MDLLLATVMTIKKFKLLFLATLISTGCQPDYGMQYEVIEELKAGDLVILKGRRQKDQNKPAIILKVLRDHDRIFIESTIWTDFHYMVYTEGKTIYVSEGHIARVLSSITEGDI